ncbi:MAG: hypothetical protein H6779_01290 [Candidatus Nomurabacteria bacterium]|nr:MAG: hypothetical protein H6779_01290 [Candidatus Nomurabacteria bacterium]
MTQYRHHYPKKTFDVVVAGRGNDKMISNGGGDMLSGGDGYDTAFLYSDSGFWLVLEKYGIPQVAKHFEDGDNIYKDTPNDYVFFDSTENVVGLAGTPVFDFEITEWGVAI